MCNTWLKSVVIGSAVMGLAACQPVGPNYVLPKNAAVNKSSAQGNFKDANNGHVNSQNTLPANWWELYNDPQLNHLVRIALKNNTSLRVADANLEKSRAQLDEADAAGGLSASTSAEYQRTGLSGEQYLEDQHLSPINLSTFGFDINYELDVWGKIRRGIEAANADTEAVLYARDLARINVVAQVTSGYMNICSSNHELAVARRNLDIQKASREVTNRMVTAGRESPMDLQQADALVSTTAAVLPALTARRDAAAYQLADVLGRTPNDLPQGVVQCSHIPTLSQPIPVGNGRSLLSRRPDVRAAERQLAAATARIGVATADLYPSISLGASAGIVGQAEDFGERRTQTWGLGPLISWHIPGNQDRARVRIAKAGAKVQLAKFDSTVLNALREVQTALSQYAQDLNQLNDLENARNHSAIAAEQARRLYQAGRSPYLNSLVADRTHVTSEMDLAKQQAAVALDQARLFLALGGGWQTQSNQTASGHKE